MKPDARTLSQRARRKRELEQSRKRVQQAQDIRIPYKGNNFRFIGWGGLEDLKLWRR